MLALKWGRAVGNHIEIRQRMYRGDVDNQNQTIGLNDRMVTRIWMPAFMSQTKLRNQCDLLTANWTDLMAADPFSFFHVTIGSL